MIINNPDGIFMHITDEHMASVLANSTSLQSHSNRIHRTAFSAVVSLTPTGAGDCFFYLKNDNDELLIVTALKLRSASAESVQVKLGDSGTVGGTHATLTPATRYGNSGDTFDHTSESGVDITGLSGGSIVDTLWAGTTMQKWIWDSGLILSKNTMLSLYAVTGAVALAATLSFHWWDTSHD